MPIKKPDMVFPPDPVRISGDHRLRYAGFSLESAKNAYVDGEIEIDDFEDAVELILLEEMFGGEKQAREEQTKLIDSYFTNFVPIIASVSVADYPPAPRYGGDIF